MNATPLTASRRLPGHRIYPQSLGLGLGEFDGSVAPVFGDVGHTGVHRSPVPRLSVVHLRGAHVEPAWLAMEKVFDAVVLGMLHGLDLVHRVDFVVWVPSGWTTDSPRRVELQTRDQSVAASSKGMTALKVSIIEASGFQGRLQAAL